ncbi:class I SAM-dependent methyltransferase [Roseomonas elaeocarpi]|uniref:Class I SAM-dependent methyltransferase n=1 Tax=Roseomonas elaeocarpi TaxID=907779 RepID=A0ABV6JZJ4_9PROT
MARVLDWLRGGRRRREAEVMAWNTKLMGSTLARAAYDQGIAGYDAPAVTEPVPAGLTGRLCRQEDIEAPWLRYWCGRQRFAPLYHRKVWEDCFVPQAVWEAGMLVPGKRALGFAVGAEYLPSLFAAHGMEVVATDLDPGDRRARDWIRTAQHGSSRDTLFQPHLLDRDAFDARVTHRVADMSSIPADLQRGGFDVVWSVCSFEHLGSIEAGLRFVTEAMRCLRPGGIAVHTTEFNLHDTGPGVERGPTVLFRRRHLEALAERLRRAGHHPLPFDFAIGNGVLDRFVDLPPYARNEEWPFPVDSGETPHLKLSVRGCVSTSAALIVRAGG